MQSSHVATEAHLSAQAPLSLPELHLLLLQLHSLSPNISAAASLACWRRPASLQAALPLLLLLLALLVGPLAVLAPMALLLLLLLCPRY